MYFAYNDADLPTGELSELPPKQEPLFAHGDNVKPIRKTN